MFTIFWDALEKKYQQATSKASASEYRSDELEENVNGKENELSASKVKYEDAKTELDSLYAEISNSHAGVFFSPPLMTYRPLWLMT